MLFDDADISISSSDIDHAYERYARSLQRTVDTLTNAERQQALMDWILSGRPRD